jgi:hypothetical protein
VADPIDAAGVIEAPLRLAGAIAGVALLSTLAGCASLASRQEGRPGVHLAEPVMPEDAGLPNFGEVAPGVLYRGAQPVVDRSRGIDGYVELIARYRIRTIVDLTNDTIDHWIAGRPRDCKQMSPAAKFSLKYIALPSIEARPSRAALASLLRIVRDPLNQPVFLHCASGENRTGALVAGYRVLVQGWDPVDASAEMTHFRLMSVWQPVNERFAAGVAAQREGIDAESRVRDPAASTPTTCP